MKIQQRSAKGLLKQMAGATAFLAILANGAAGPKTALAADGAVSTAATAAQAAATRAYWTAERLTSAKPLYMTTAKTLSPASGLAVATGPTTLTPGAPPSVAYDRNWAEALLTLSNSTSSEVSPTAVGTTGPLYPYTIDRLYPCAGSGCPQSSNSYSDVFNFYPYAVVGQLFFTEPSGNFVCSASVIRLNVIATAGHCVSDGNGNFYTNWLFIPAYHAGVAPFGRWNWAQVVVTGPWFHGGGSIPNRQDDAVIVLQENSGQKIGQVTGYLGYEFNAQPSHLTQLGYPCNLDTTFGDCVQSIQFGPIRDDSEVFSGPNNNFEWGSAAFGGASGGPEIQDFGQQPLHASGHPAIRGVRRQRPDRVDLVYLQHRYAG
jgi:V8-like Glu-specific endopeptidase